MAKCILCNYDYDRWLGDKTPCVNRRKHHEWSSPRVSGWDFLKLMAAAGIVMTFARFVDWGKGTSTYKIT
jgi:hypothetical protein